MNRPLNTTLFFITLFLFLNTFAYAAGFVYNTHGRRDPFVPSYLQDESEKKPVDENIIKEVDYSSIVLQAVIYDLDGDSIVIINDEIMKIDDRTDFFIIKDIMRDGVVMEILGEGKVFKLREDKNNSNDEK